MMGLARRQLARVPGIGFWRLCGAGTGEGFTPWPPETGICAILATWPDAATAWRQTEEAEIFGRYAARAAESWTLYLIPVSARGAWSRQQPFAAAEGAPKGGPLAALTRATLRPLKALRFWRHAPAVSLRIGGDPNVIFKIGLGEVPLLNQITFSIWPDTASMAEFARADGAHARAIRAVRDGGWFREELYARFAVTGSRGCWGGTHPLKDWRLAA